MAESKMIVFVAPKYKELTLVKRGMGRKDAQGNRLERIVCDFKPSQYGYAYITDDKEMIEWLKKHEYFRTGKIHLFDPEASQATVEKGTAVIRGGATTAPAKTEEVTAEAPQAAAKPARKGAKVK